MQQPHCWPGVGGGGVVTACRSPLYPLTQTFHGRVAADLCLAPLNLMPLSRAQVPQKKKKQKKKTPEWILWASGTSVCTSVCIKGELVHEHDRGVAQGDGREPVTLVAVSKGDETMVVPDMVQHRRVQVFIPEEGSSMSTTGESPSRAMATCSFLFMPPDRAAASVCALSVSPTACHTSLRIQDLGSRI